MIKGLYFNLQVSALHCAFEHVLFSKTHTHTHTHSTGLLIAYMDELPAFVNEDDPE